MMSLASKRELLTVTGPRYRAAHGADQERILNEFVAATGYHRKYAIRLLNHPPQPKPRRQRRPRTGRYTPQVKTALVKIWEVANRICAKRLVPELAKFVDALERHGELVLDAETKAALLKISPATADRLLRTERRGTARRGLTTTKPGTLLKHQIPIRTFADWDDAQPGFVEVDLVAHCGESTEGEYLNSLVLTDITTTWTECVALLNRSQQTVKAAIDQVRQRLPFPLKGLDSDNGSEFINANLARYCEQEQITFTRCRPYHKNDQAHVEQKNWSIVRQMVGYDRFEGREAQRRLASVYDVLRLYTNFFQPTMKLISKERVGAKVKKKYDTAKTPYQRVLDDDRISPEVKQALREQYLTLNPAELLRQIEQRQEALWRYAKVRSALEATLRSG